MGHKKIIVIGAGIIGASLAYHLAAGGASVVVVDGQPHTGGVATPNTWAWINASWGNPEPYVKLRMRSMALWRQLAVVNPQLAVNWCGGLLWDLGETELLVYAAQHQAWGYGARVVDGAEAMRLEPRLIAPPKLAVHAAGEGMIEPQAAVQGFVDAAKQHGAQFISGRMISHLVVQGGRVVAVKLGDDEFSCDEVVLAGGIGSVDLLKGVGLTLKVDAPAGLLVHTEVAPKILNGLVMSPEFHVRQTSEGRLVLGTDFTGTQPGDHPEETAKVVLAKLPGLIGNTAHLKMDFFTIGYRPTPADGFPIIGRPSALGGIYVAVTHSGVTLAPAMGALGAAEILDDERDALLEPYQADRLISA